MVHRKRYENYLYVTGRECKKLLNLQHKNTCNQPTDTTYAKCPGKRNRIQPTKTADYEF